MLQIISSTSSPISSKNLICSLYGITMIKNIIKQPTTTIASKKFHKPPSMNLARPVNLILAIKSANIKMFKRHSVKMKAKVSSTTNPSIKVIITKAKDESIKKR
jgi:hypothetical protein